MRRGLGELSQEERQVMAELRAQAAGTDNKGGYTVPKEMQARIVEQMKAFGGIASVAQILNTADGRVITWATANGTAEEGELIGENTAATELDTEFGTAELGAKNSLQKLSAYQTNCYKIQVWILKSIYLVELQSVLVVQKLNILFKVLALAHLLNLKAYKLLLLV